ncbi:hypothetical protein Tco_0156132 [Tanacetum coccineum]
MPTEMELTLEQTQQGVSYEISVLPTIGAANSLADSHKDGHGGTWFQLTHRFIITCSYPTDKQIAIIESTSTSFKTSLLLYRTSFFEDIDDGAQVVPAPIHVPPPPAAGRTMPQRLGRLEEEVQGLRQDVRSLRGLVERSMTDQGRFSTWMVSCMTQLMEASGLTY